MGRLRRWGDGAMEATDHERRITKYGGLNSSMYICAMFKYRRLTKEELELLEESFIRFLAAQSIPAEDWKKIQEKDKKRHDELIDQFSDVVIEKTLHNVKILEHRSAKRVLFFQFLEDEANLYGIEFKNDPPLILNEGFRIEEFAELLNNNELSYSILNGEKQYKEDKLTEIFQVIQQGAQIPRDEELFNFVLKIVEKSI
jgi:hypothetical protein